MSDRYVSEEIAALDVLLKQLEITSWDFLLVGDGSGTKWDQPSGWAATVIGRRGLFRRVFHGGANYGTNNTAELMAYAYPLLWLASVRRQQKTADLWNVHVITDSAWVAAAGKNPAQRKANKELWFLLDAARRSGIALYWHHLPRDTTALNRFAHNLANLARISQQGLKAQALSETGGAASISELTPSE